MLTEALVSSPAKINETPSASTNGHAVGAGRTTVSGLPVTCWSGVSIAISQVTYTRNKIHHRQYHHPDGIHKVPVHGEDLDPLRVLLLHVARAAVKIMMIESPVRPTIT